VRNVKSTKDEFCGTRGNFPRLLRLVLVPPFSSVSGARGKTSSVSPISPGSLCSVFPRQQSGRQAIIAVIKCGSSDEQLYRRAILDSGARRARYIEQLPL